MADAKQGVLLAVQERLKEEKWTRVAIDNYTVKNFIELDNILRLTSDNGLQNDLKSILREHLQRSQGSIVALYLSGILALEDSSADDTHIPQIIRIFIDHKKHRVAEFLAEKMLGYRENKYALRSLEVVYQEQGMVEELFSVRKRLALIDTHDAQNAKVLGDHYEAEGDIDQALFYYRIAVERYIKAGRIKMVEELWMRMLTLYMNDTDMIVSIAKKVRDVLDDDAVADSIFDTAIRVYMRDEQYLMALALLKYVVQLKPAEKKIRKALEDCYTALYKDHGYLDHYLKTSAIGQTWKPYREAIRFFEAHIAFDEGSYVLHKNWGLGKVQKLSKDAVEIDFHTKGVHQMSLAIALRALEVLDPSHIAVWKLTRLEELQQRVQNDPLAVLEIVLRSQDSRTILPKDVKAILTPDVLAEGAWTSWWARCKKLMNESSVVVYGLSKKNLIELRDVERSVFDEMVSRFKKTSTFDKKLDLLIAFVARGGDINQPAANAITQFFVDTLSSSTESVDKRLISFLGLRMAQYQRVSDDLIDSTLLFGVKNFVDLYVALPMELRQPFLELLQQQLKDWDVRYAELLVSAPVSNKLYPLMLDELLRADKLDVVHTVFVTALNSFGENSELFIWMARMVFEELDDATKAYLGIQSMDITLRLFSLLDILESKIEAKIGVTENRRLLGQVQNILFKSNILEHLVQEADEAVVHSLYSLITASIGMDTELKQHYRSLIRKRLPALGAQAVEKDKPKPGKALKIRPPLLVTKASYSQKKSSLEELLRVAIPENSANIGEAMEKGDLRENAEYKAALEKQDQLKASVSKLESELRQAKILQQDQVDTTFVDVGTKVTLEERGVGTLAYEILGPWSVDFEHGVISYHSPFGRALLDRKVGDSFTFEFNGVEKEFTILQIELANFQ